MNTQIREAIEKTLQKEEGCLNIIDYKIDGQTISFYILFPEKTKTITVTDPAELLTMNCHIHDQSLSYGTVAKSSYEESATDREEKHRALSRLGSELFDQLIESGVCNNL